MMKAKKTLKIILTMAHKTLIINYIITEIQVKNNMTTKNRKQSI